MPEQRIVATAMVPPGERNEQGPREQSPFPFLCPIILVGLLQFHPIVSPVPPFSLPPSFLLRRATMWIHTISLYFIILVGRGQVLLLPSTIATPSSSFVEVVATTHCRGCCCRCCFRWRILGAAAATTKVVVPRCAFSTSSVRFETLGVDDGSSLNILLALSSLPPMPTSITNKTSITRWCSRSWYRPVGEQ